MKWWAFPVLIGGFFLALVGLVAEDDGSMFFLGAGLLGLGALLLTFLPYAGSRDAQKLTAKQDRTGLAVTLGAVLALILVVVAASALVNALNPDDEPRHDRWITEA